jgi:TolA-binding protein
MAKKIKVSRKKIKRPDEFLTYSDRVLNYVSANKNIAYGVVSGVILVIVAINLINYTIKTNRAKADMLMSEAFAAMQTPLAGQLKGSKTYANDKQRNEDAISKLNEVVKKFSDSEAGLEARYRLGEAYFANGDFKSSLTAYDDFLKQLKSKPAPASYLEFSTYLGMGKCYYAQGEYQKAVESFQKVLDAKEAASAYKPESLLGTARARISLKQYDQANTSLQELIKTYPGSVYDQLANLELAKIAAAKAGK